MLEFETAQDRLLILKKINMLLIGVPGIGKTYAARSLDPATTLFIDCEAGTLSLEKSKDLPAWQGTTMSMLRMASKAGVHPWELCRAMACLLMGPDPSQQYGPYSLQAYNSYVQNLLDGDVTKLNGFVTIFVDSLTVVSQWAFNWACAQPECISEKTGNLDKRGAYGLLGTELVTWANALQHQPKNIVLSCILAEKEDDFGRKSWNMLIEGQSARDKIRGIFDLVTTLAWVDFGEQHGKQRVFVTQEGNELGFPAKDRSGLLEPYEAPDLGALMNKIQNFNA